MVFYIGFVHIINYLFRVENILYVYKILYAYKTLLYMYKYVLYWTRTKQYCMCTKRVESVKMFFITYKKSVYAYQMFYMRTKGFVCIQMVLYAYNMFYTPTKSVVHVQNSLYGYKRLCTRPDVDNKYSVMILSRDFCVHGLGKGGGGSLFDSL